MMDNIPVIKLGLVAVSRDCFPIALSDRDCFPIALSEKRRAAIAAKCGQKELNFVEIKTTVENEKDMLKAVEELNAAGCNAACVFLGNFGPETPETLIAEKFDGPVMFVAAAEGDGDMINGRGDAYCGMLNCSYNLGMRHLKGYIPEYPVGTAEELADKIAEFIPIARVIVGLKNLKIITFGPRPQDFFARTSSPATPRLRACMNWASKSRRTANWICWSATKSTPATSASPKSPPTWPRKWAKANIILTCSTAWLSLN